MSCPQHGTAKGIRALLPLRSKEGHGALGERLRKRHRGSRCVAYGPVPTGSASARQGAKHCCGHSCLATKSRVAALPGATLPPAQGGGRSQQGKFFGNLAPPEFLALLTALLDHLEVLLTRLGVLRPSLIFSRCILSAQVCPAFYPAQWGSRKMSGGREGQSRWRVKNGDVHGSVCKAVTGACKASSLGPLALLLCSKACHVILGFARPSTISGQCKGRLRGLQALPLLFERLESALLLCVLRLMGLQCCGRDYTSEWAMGYRRRVPERRGIPCWARSFRHGIPDATPHACDAPDVAPVPVPVH